MRLHEPRSTLRSCICYTPWQSSLQCFCPQFESGSFETAKNKAQHDAFQYVVLRQPATPRMEPLLAGRYEYKTAIKREQNQDFLDTAEREQSRGISRKGTNISGNKSQRLQKVSDISQILSRSL